MQHLHQLQQYFNTGATHSYAFRIQQLQQLRYNIKKYEAELLNALKLDLNKPATEAYASEISILYSEIKHACKHLKKWMKPQKVASPLALFYSKSFVQQVPLGTVLIISPWNYPVQLALAPLIGALAAGNCIVLKPSEFTPNVNKVLDLIISSSFSKQHIIQIEGIGTQVIPQLIDSVLIQHVFFTGSSQVGKLIAKQCTQHLIPYTLELGGKSPTIIDSSANLAVAAKRIVWAKFYNAGQTCVAPDYILVHDSIKAQFVIQLKKYIQELYINADAYTRIITPQRFDLLCSYLTDSKIIHGGGVDKGKLFIEPTLIDEPSLAHPIMQNEIFGPLLPILSYQTMGDLQAIIAKNPTPLALYIFSQNKTFIHSILQSIQFGGGAINSALIQVANLNLPFGGVMTSGNGNYHGKYSFATFSHAKAIINMSTHIDIALKYPPYTKFKHWLLKNILD